MPTIFVSDAIGAERLDLGAPAPGGGMAALSALYRASFASACGCRVVPVLRPEIYAAEAARHELGVGGGDWHLAVKPIEHLRPFHGMPNVFVCDWPFAELSTAPLGGSPFFDQLHLLQRADAVLCCTEFTAETIRRAGVERAVTLPPAIPMEMRDAPRPGGTGGRFLSVVDPRQLSRQLGDTIEGFARAHARDPALRLTVCLQGGDVAAIGSLRQRFAQTGPALAGVISIVNDAGGLGGLLAEADFLLCAHSAAGLHVPLAQAMLAGVPLVATVTAGTASILPPQSAIPIATRRKTVDGDDEPIGRFMALTEHPARAEALCEAMLAAVATDGAARSRMAATAQAAARRQFGADAFRAGLARLGAFVDVRPA